jgi:hypothetical protein
MANVDGEALDVESRVGGVHFQPGLSNFKTSVACVQSGSPNYLPFLCYILFHCHATYPHPRFPEILKIGLWIRVNSFEPGIDAGA